MKFLIAGFGSIGRRHMQNLKALGVDDIIVFRTGRSTLDLDDLAGIRVEMDLDAALALKPDAVVIANPTSLHLNVAMKAAEAGCHLFLEKPVSHNLDGIDSLIKVLARTGKKTFVGFQFRFHPGLLKVKELLKERTLGRPLAARAHWGEYLPNWHPWEDYRESYSARKDLGGGVTLTLCHPLDYLGWLFGDVDSQWAFIGGLSDLELQVEDVAEIGLHFISGVLGTVHLNYFQRPAVHRLEIICTEGTILWDNEDGKVRFYRVEEDTWDEFPLPLGFERNDLFLAEMRHFLDVVDGKADPVCSLEDGIKSLLIATTAMESPCKTNATKLE